MLPVKLFDFFIIHRGHIFLPFQNIRFGTQPGERARWWRLPVGWAFLDQNLNELPWSQGTHVCFPEESFHFPDQPRQPSFAKYQAYFFRYDAGFGTVKIT